MILNKFYVDDVIRSAIKEDINYIDVSACYTIPEDQKGTAYFVAKADGVLCGIDVAMRVFELLDDSFYCTLYRHDGDEIKKGDRIADFGGSMMMLLQGERTALNLLQMMSGVATATNECVRAVEGTGCSIAETRKTTPGLRALQKYAVTCGGGRNHRYNLSDCVMLKDNHIDACGSITAAVGKVREKLGHTAKIEVETRDFDEVREAVAVNADIIMLDNMTPGDMKKCVAYIGGRALTEASGNVTIDNIRSVAECGIDIISIGALTHSVKAMDISMKLK